MRNRLSPFLTTAALACLACAHAAQAQAAALPAPSPVEKALAARASDVTEVTLGKNMLAFAAKIMNGKDEDDVATRHLIEGLDGIYVREYEFDKAGEFTPDDVDQLRKYFATDEWSPIVKERERKTGESTDVMMKLVNGESRGLFVLDVEPKDLTIVLILGPIKMDDLGKLKGLSGLGSLGDLAVNVKDKDKDKPADKAAGKDKSKADKKGAGE